MGLGRRRAALRMGLSAVVAVGALAVAFPYVTGTGWGALLRQLEVLSVLQVALLVVVWLAGLCCYAMLMTASLPKLTLGQALTLNLSGSAVSNLVPAGGALGMGLTYAMVRSWGFRRSSFALFTAFTTLWNIVAKLVLPFLALLGLVLAGQVVDGRLTVLTGAAAAVLVGVLVVVGGALVDVRITRVLARFAYAASVRVGRPAVGLAERLLEFRVRAVDLLRRRWPQMSLGMFGYMALQVLLLWLILRMLHSHLPLSAVFAGYAFERLLTLLVITPGGVGIAQTGAAAVLVALGGPPPRPPAGVLLFSVFTFFLEIPVGAVGGMLWWRRRGRMPHQLLVAGDGDGALTGAAGRAGANVITAASVEELSAV
jgi:uncharacterized membrane protein YbhN (UPF0104 family)